MWKRVTLSRRSRGTRTGVQNPAVFRRRGSSAGRIHSSGRGLRSPLWLLSLPGGGLTHSPQSSEDEAPGPREEAHPEGGFAVCTRGAHEEDGTCRPHRIWGCGGPQRPAPGQDPPPRAPLGSGTVKHLRIMNSQPHTAEAEAAILSGCLPDTRALRPQSWASGSSLRPRRPSVPRAGGST